MPNHVINEIVFAQTDRETHNRIVASICNKKGKVDFGVLLPVPLNCWMGSVGKKHNETFPDTALDWCSKNWGTKWGPYGDPSIKHLEGSTVLQFKTAWSPPMGWLCALFNSLEMSFTYSWLSEGESGAHTGEFNWEQLGTCFSDAWKESEADAAMLDHLGALLWSEESWNVIKSERSATA